MAIRLSENFRALFYAPFYAAEATGAFKEAGVEVILVPSPDPPSAVKALMAGEVDVMWGGPLRVMISHHADPESPLVCFCDVVARDPFFIVGRTPNPNFKFTDLRMLRFASVSEVPTPWICLANDIRKAGVAFDTPPANDGAATARCLILVTPDAQRTMNTFLGASTGFGPADLDALIVFVVNAAQAEEVLFGAAGCAAKLPRCASSSSRLLDAPLAKRSSTRRRRSWPPRATRRATRRSCAGRLRRVDIANMATSASLLTACMN